MKIITTAIFILNILLSCTIEETQKSTFCSTEYQASNTLIGEWSICNPFSQESIYKIYPSSNTGKYYIENEDGYKLEVDYTESSLVYDTIDSNGKVLRMSYYKARPNEGTYDYISVAFLKIYEQENCCAYTDDTDSELGLTLFNTGEPKFDMLRVLQ